MIPAAIRGLAMSVVLLIGTAAGLAGGGVAGAAIPAGYTVSTLRVPQPAGSDYVAAASAVAIDSAGDVVGQVQGAFGTSYPGNPIRWHNGKPTWLGPKGQIGAANDINEAKLAVGWTRATLDALPQAAILTKGKATALTGLGGDASAALGINPTGAVVGWAATAERGDPARRIHACVWQDGSVLDLGALDAATGDSLASDINAAGAVVGVSTTEPGNFTPWENPVDLAFSTSDGHATLWDAGEVTDLGTLGGTGSVATAINDKGQVAGSSRTTGDNQPSHGFVWQDGQMSDLGVLPDGGDASYAFDINNDGQIVGLIENYGAYGRVAFLWQDGTMVDLNTLIPPDSGWVLLGGWGINDAGQIVGFGQGPNGESIFMLTPNA